MHAQGRAARACKNWWIFFNHPDGANTLFTDPGDAAANVLTGSESSTCCLLYTSDAADDTPC
eukprot:1852011-Pyramimonas_sp.AAC.1